MFSKDYCRVFQWQSIELDEVDDIGGICLGFCRAIKDYLET